MGNRQLPFSVFRGLAIIALLSIAVPSQAAPAGVVARPTWGAALSLSAPVELNFSVGANTRAWKRRNAGGGAKIEGDPDGARAFVTGITVPVDGGFLSSAGV